MRILFTLLVWCAAAADDSSEAVLEMSVETVDVSETAAAVPISSASQADKPHAESSEEDVIGTDDESGVLKNQPDGAVPGSVSQTIENVGPAAALVKESFSYEGDDFPGADGGVLVALPPRASGPVEPLELSLLTEAINTDIEGEDSASVAILHRVWPEGAEIVPYYEWMIAQARGNRFALPEPIVQQLDQLERAMEAFDLTSFKEVPIDHRRRLQLDSLLNLLSATNSGHSLLSAGSDSGLAFDAQQFPGLVNVISGSVANVVQAAGEAVGVTTTTAKPVSQAVLGMLSILQGFQKLAEAAGSMGLQFKAI